MPARAIVFNRLFGAYLETLLVWCGNSGHSFRDETAATAIEYALIAAGISVAIIAIAKGVGTKLNGPSCPCHRNRRKSLAGPEPSSGASRTGNLFAKVWTHGSSDLLPCHRTFRAMPRIDLDQIGPTFGYACRWPPVELAPLRAVRAVLRAGVRGAARFFGQSSPAG